MLQASALQKSSPQTTYTRGKRIWTFRTVWAQSVMSAWATPPCARLWAQSAATTTGITHAVLARPASSCDRGEKRLFFFEFPYEHRCFAKTGSGHVSGKLPKETAVLSRYGTPLMISEGHHGAVIQAKVGGNITGYGQWPLFDGYYPVTPYSTYPTLSVQGKEEMLVNAVSS